MLVGDLRKAYYTVLRECVTGPMCTQAEREALLANLKMDELTKQSIISDLASGHCRFDDLPFAERLDGSA